MSEKMFEEAFKYAMEELHNQYINENRESEFVFNFNVSYVEDSIDTVTVSVASPFMKNQVTSKGSLSVIENKLREVTGLNNLKVECIIKADSSPAVSSTPAVSHEISGKENKSKESSEEVVEKPVVKNITKKQHPQLSEDFTFDSFVPGDNSNYAYNAALAVAKNPGKKYNPILFYGGSGLGKTHLMQAIGNYIYQNDEDNLKIVYLSAEDFTNDFTNSLTSKKANEFKNKYRNLDVLLLDDIHFLQNKTGIQEELFHTFDALSQKKAQMVFTCDRPIKEIKNMAERLVSRLSKGLCIDLTVPDYETRIAILQKKVEIFGKTLDPEIIDFIAKNIETNVRDLEAALNKVIGLEELMGQKITLDNVKSQLKDLISSSSENVSLEVIQKVIADNYQISITDLKGKKRDKKYVTPRHIAMYISRELTELSFTELGIEFGGRDHSTVMNACENIEEQIKVDSSFESKIQLFIREIKEYKK